MKRKHIASNKAITPNTTQLLENNDLLNKTIDPLVEIEIENLTKQINLNGHELRAWIKLQTKKLARIPAELILDLLRVANQYRLNPLQNQVFLAHYEKSWQVSISVDGWIHLINQNPAFSGVTFTESPDCLEGVPAWIECTIYRSDRVIPTTIREYYCEVKNTSEVWDKMPRRMLRHRSLQQCARLALGIALPERCEEIIRADRDIDKASENTGRTLPTKALGGMELLRAKLEKPTTEKSN